MPVTDPPLRYVCHACGTCIATAENLQASKDDALAFSSLYISAPVDKSAMTVTCPNCDSPLGSRGAGGAAPQFSLRKERVLKRPDGIEILVCSLKESEISELTPLLQKAFPRCNTTGKVLKKAELRGFDVSAAKPSPDLVVVAHKNEGRVLLTDRNGFYTDVLGSAWRLTKGNVLVVLTRTEPKGEANLCDQPLLQALSTQGDQPTIGAISALGRVLTWESTPNDAQVAQLEALALKAYYREPMTAANNRDLPPSWLVKTSGGKGNPNWCNLL